MKFPPFEELRVRRSRLRLFAEHAQEGGRYDHACNQHELFLRRLLDVRLDMLHKHSPHLFNGLYTIILVY